MLCAHNGESRVCCVFCLVVRSFGRRVGCEFMTLAMTGNHYLVFVWTSLLAEDLQKRNAQQVVDDVAVVQLNVPYHSNKNIASRLSLLLNVCLHHHRSPSLLVPEYRRVFVVRCRLKKTFILNKTEQQKIFKLKQKFFVGCVRCC